MAFCAKCGTQIDGNYSHCPACGAEQIPVQQPRMQAQGGYAQQGAPAAQHPGARQAAPAGQGRQLRRPRQGKKKGVNKGLIIGLCAILVAAVAVAAVVLFLTNRSRSFSVKDAVLITTEGFDGAGTLRMTVDQEELLRIIESSNSQLTKKQTSELMSTIEFSIADKDRQNLSNGQEVTINVRASSSLLERLKMKLAEESWTYTVEDLREIETVDPFAYVEVEFTGISPNLSAQISTSQVNSDIGTLQYAFEGFEDSWYGASGLAIGDTLTLRVTTDESNVLKKGYRFASTEKAYTIDDNHDQYVTSPELLDDTALARMQKEAEDVINSHHARMESVMDVSTPVFEGVIFQNGKNNVADNCVYLVYSYTCSNPTEDIDVRIDFYDKTLYYPVQYPAVVKYADGRTDHNDIKYDLGSNIAFGGFTSMGAHWIRGYTDEHDMFTEIVRKNTDNYTFTFSDEMQALYDAD